MTPNFTDPKGHDSTVLGEAVDLQIWICFHEHILGELENPDSKKIYEGTN